jgi:hypothetical protein
VRSSEEKCVAGKAGAPQAIEQLRGTLARDDDVGRYVRRKRSRGQHEDLLAGPGPVSGMEPGVERDASQYDGVDLLVELRPAV